MMSRGLDTHNNKYVVNIITDTRPEHWHSSIYGTEDPLYSARDGQVVACLTAPQCRIGDIAENP